MAYVSGFLLQSSVVWHTHRLGVELASQMIELAPKSFGGWFILGHHILPRPFRTLIVLGDLLEPEPVVVAAAAECCCFSFGLAGLELLDLCSECKICPCSLWAQTTS
jgi:hypothetical protein